MSRMLGNSRTWRWALCACRSCRHHHPRGGRPGKWYRKRAARNREEKLWRKEQT